MEHQNSTSALQETTHNQGRPATVGELVDSLLALGRLTFLLRAERDEAIAGREAWQQVAEQERGRCLRSLPPGAPEWCDARPTPEPTAFTVEPLEEREARWQKSEDQLVACQGQVEDLERRNAMHVAANGDLSDRLSVVDDERRAAFTQVVLLTTERDDLRGELTGCRGQVKDLAMRLASVESQREITRNELARASEEMRAWTRWTSRLLEVNGVPPAEQFGGGDRREQITELVDGLLAVKALLESQLATERGSTFVLGEALRRAERDLKSERARVESLGLTLAKLREPAVTGGAWKTHQLSCWVDWAELFLRERSVEPTDTNEGDRVAITALVERLEGDLTVSEEYGSAESERADAEALDRGKWQRKAEHAASLYSCVMALVRGLDDVVRLANQGLDDEPEAVLLSRVVEARTLGLLTVVRCAKLLLDETQPRIEAACAAHVAGSLVPPAQTEGAEPCDAGVERSSVRASEPISLELSLGVVVECWGSVDAAERLSRMTDEALAAGAFEEPAPTTPTNDLPERLEFDTLPPTASPEPLELLESDSLPPSAGSNINGFSGRPFGLAVNESPLADCSAVQVLGRSVVHSSSDNSGPLGDENHCTGDQGGAVETGLPVPHTLTEALTLNLRGEAVSARVTRQTRTMPCEGPLCVCSPGETAVRCEEFGGACQNKADQREALTAGPLFSGGERCAVFTADRLPDSFPCVCSWAVRDSGGLFGCSVVGNRSELVPRVPPLGVKFGVWTPAWCDGQAVGGCGVGSVGGGL